MISARQIGARTLMFNFNCSLGLGFGDGFRVRVMAMVEYVVRDINFAFRVRGYSFALE